MKKLLFLNVLFTAMILLGCGGKAQQQVEREEDTIDVNNLIGDHTLYGLCGGQPSESQLLVLTDNGDTVKLDVTRAKTDNKFLGSVKLGDRLAVMTNKNRTEATEVVNINLLLGNWVMPDPLDGSDEIGIRIQEGGVAESIEMTNILHRTWRIYNGKLQIVSVREGGGDLEETNLYEIVKLSADTLIYKTIGKPQDEEETFEYTRWKKKEQPDLHGLKLEEHQDEFMKM